ncbi:MAG: ABC transporter permease [Acetobacteraceae bacterium]|nr:ABC transporter permease [Acetobacteraceae bacterium]
MTARELLSALTRDRLGLVGLILFGIFALTAVFAPLIAPFDPMQMHFRPDGTLARLEPPSASHWLGTTRMGRDVFSQVVMGARPALLVGVLSAVCVVAVGTNVGIVAGYYGGWVDDLLMRLTDLAFGVPFLPFALILVALLGPGLRNMVIAIVLVMWRSSARVVRAQVLTLKRRAFVEAARIGGAGNLRILYRHLLPSVLPLALVYTALAMAWAIMAEANLSFLGYADPRMASWGKILYECYTSQAMFVAWWWMVPPGAAITLLVLSGFLVGRAYEEVANPRLRRR